MTEFDEEGFADTLENNLENNLENKIESKIIFLKFLFLNNFI